jgi:hypothetical protein
MKRLRIVSTRPAAAKPPAPLPEDVDRLLPYTTDAYGPLTTPVTSSRSAGRPRVGRWIGFGLLGLSSLMMLGVAIVIFAMRPDSQPALSSIQAPVMRLRADGRNTLGCRADGLAVFVEDDGAGDGVLVGTLSGPNASLVFTLDGGEGGYKADITIDGGVLGSASAVRGEPVTVWPGETLLLQVGGVPEARRLLVTGSLSFGSREGEVCQ